MALIYVYLSVYTVISKSDTKFTTLISLTKSRLILVPRFERQKQITNSLIKSLFDDHKVQHKCNIRARTKILVWVPETIIGYPTTQNTRKRPASNV